MLPQEKACYMLFSMAIFPQVTAVILTNVILDRNSLMPQRDFRTLDILVLMRQSLFASSNNFQYFNS